MKKPVLQLQHLAVRIGKEERAFHPVKDASLTIHGGEMLCLVGESACGKSMTAMAIMGLLPPLAEISNGAILLQGKDITHTSDKRALRGRDIGMIFQEPMTSLNPVYRIGEQIKEALLVHNPMTEREARNLILDMMNKVGIVSTVYHAYPHQLSGGMRQRVMIAMALICRPSLLIADEPTTALDVTIQSQILHLLQQLNTDMNTAILLITHDLGIAAQVADRVAVMYAGYTVENSATHDFFSRPRHPYTHGLLNCLPNVDKDEEGELQTIQGSVPDAHQRITGCVFENRCPHRTARCARAMPAVEELGSRHNVRCFHHERVR